MKLTVNLWSRKHGEIKRFLERYYDSSVATKVDAVEWSCAYNKPLEAVDIISAIMDNYDKYQITIFIQVDEGQLHHITFENYNEVVKDIFQLFYNENFMAFN